MSRSEKRASLNRGSLDPSTAALQLMTYYGIMHAWGSHAGSAVKEDCY